MGSSSVCAEQQHHKFHHSHHLNLNKKILREIDIPPRKLLSLSRRSLHLDHSDLFMDSPKLDESLLHKYFPCNNLDDDDDDDPYSADQFRMFEFKVRKCTRSRSHDWTDCPFAHPGEKARRRDPRRYHYSGTVCPEFRRGNCTRGDNCEFSHGVFECWLHPSRYRTEACKDGKNCKRKICFFAHTSRQLRLLPPNCQENPPLNSPLPPPSPSALKQCCVYCHSSMAAAAAATASSSPTSTLLGMSHMSPPMSPSPPRSPVRPAAARFSRYKDTFGNIDPSGFLQFNCAGGLSYKDAVNELMNSMEAMQLMNQQYEPTSPPLVAAAAAAANTTTSTLPWVDVNSFNGEDHSSQFIMSPSSNPSPLGVGGGGRTSKFGNSSKFFVEENEVLGGPDLGWVNDLLT